MNDGTEFAYWCEFTRPAAGGGTQDPETGVFTPSGPATLVAEGWFDVQDAGEALPRSSTGQAVKDSDSTWFAKDEAIILALEPGDVGTVRYPDSGLTAEGEVKFVRELDGAVLVKYR